MSQDDRTESRNEGEEPVTVESGTEDERSNGLYDLSDKISQLEESCSLDPEVFSDSAQGNLHHVKYFENFHFRLLLKYFSYYNPHRLKVFLEAEREDIMIIKTPKIIPSIKVTGENDSFIKFEHLNSEKSEIEVQLYLHDPSVGTTLDYEGNSSPSSTRPVQPQEEEEVCLCPTSRQTGQGQR